MSPGRSVLPAASMTRRASLASRPAQWRGWCGSLEAIRPPAPAPTSRGPRRGVLWRPPPLLVPLTQHDAGLATRGPRPTLEQLLRYQYGNPALMFDPRATMDEWQLARPDMSAVRGYADAVSVLPGQPLK